VARELAGIPDAGAEGESSGGREDTGGGKALRD